MLVDLSNEWIVAKRSLFVKHFEKNSIFNCGQTKDPLNLRRKTGLSIVYIIFNQWRFPMRFLLTLCVTVFALVSFTVNASAQQASKTKPATQEAMDEQELEAHYGVDD